MNSSMFFILNRLQSFCKTIHTEAALFNSIWGWSKVYKLLFTFNLQNAWENRYLEWPTTIVVITDKCIIDKQKALHSYRFDFLNRF